MAERGEISWDTVEEWEAETGDKKLPKRVRRRKNPSKYRELPEEIDSAGLKSVIEGWQQHGQKVYDRSFPVWVPTKALWKHREYKWERGKSRVTESEWDKTLMSLDKHGWKKKEPLHLMVGRKGGVKVGEGNHRLVMARELGIEEVPVVIHFYSGEVVKNRLNPSKKRKNPAKEPTFDTGLLVWGTPGNRTLVLFDVKKLSKVKEAEEARLYDGSLIVGFLEMEDSSMGLDAYEVHSAAAEKGWGPALYDLASEVAAKDDMGGIHPMVQTNTKAVMKMWRKFPKSRQIDEPMSKVGFILAPPRRRKVGLPQVKAASKFAIRNAAKRVGWSVDEMEGHLVETGDAMFREMYKNQQVKEKSPESSDEKYVLYKVAAYDESRNKAYSEFGGKKTWFSLRKGAKIKGAPGKTLHTSHDKQFVLDYYTEMTDDPDVLLVLEADRNDVEKIEGDEVIVRQATLLEAVHL